MNGRATHRGEASPDGPTPIGAEARWAPAALFALALVADAACSRATCADYHDPSCWTPAGADDGGAETGSETGTDADGGGDDADAGADSRADAEPDANAETDADAGATTDADAATGF